MSEKNIKMRQKSLKFIQMLYVIAVLIIVDGFNSVSTQKQSERGQMPIGAFRVFEKTTFSCLGRPAGYYADIETGCQVYHMCDGLGRQFSYSCPNTTLFQQRMLICDHWYMVNCSKAESDYAANLLIGQRDKPFVPEEENQLRTPRPDLLDRPYAPDYSGESFRNQYKDHRQISNEISDSDGTEKQYFHEVNPPSATRWHLPRSNSAVPLPKKSFIRRNDVVDENITVDLGTSHSSNYNSSGDFSAEVSSSSVPTQRTTSRLITTVTTTTTTTPPPPKTTPPPPPTTTTTDSPIPTTIPYIKPPSRLYEPPFLYPIYNLNYTETEEDQEANDQESSTISTTATTIRTTPTTTTPAPTTTSTTKLPFSKPAIFPGRPFTSSVRTSVTPTFSYSTATTEKYEESTRTFFKPKTTGSFVTRTQINHSTPQPKIFQTQAPTTTSEQPSIDISTPYLDLLPPKVDRLSPPAPFKAKSNLNELPTPSKSLLPPLQEFVTHDVATTQGPPIYFEWKIPSDALEPPKFDPAPGTEERNLPNDDISIAGSTTITENHTTISPFANNPFLAPILNSRDQQSTKSSNRTPTVRSIPNTTTVQSVNFSTQDDDNDDENAATKKNNNLADVRKDINIQQLQKDFLIPDFLFPLENDARIGYEQSNIVNSFQLKIPERRDNEKPWYGENPACPECHPSFVKPGTCEPCVRRR